MEGCVHCNSWGHPGDKHLVMQLIDDDLAALKDDIAWEWGLTFFQTGFSLPAFCFAMHSLSLPLMIDPWILRDSIVASLLTIFVSYVVWHACEEGPMRWSTALYLGLILGLAATLREQLVYYAIFFLPLVLVSLRAAHASLRHALLILLLLVGPMVLARIGLESWNKTMTGQAVVSANARTVMLQAVLPGARDSILIFLTVIRSLIRRRGPRPNLCRFLSEVGKLNKLLLSREIRRNSQQARHR